ncbi:hypothetical protein [Endozoicomonas acroporae]|uniref:hypothetical protein n=1 Tax=Endozoicomonas acroporae TaxID=1701104 RepID=UPI003D79595D
MIQPPTMPGSVTASASQPATSQSVEPQGRWGRLGVCSESDAIPLLQGNTREENPVNDHSSIKNRQQDLQRKPASTSPIDGSQLDQPIGNNTHPFTGSLRGENGTIGNLSHCLVQTLGGTGQIDGLNFNGANIRDKGPVAVAACTIADAAMVSNIKR